MKTGFIVLLVMVGLSSAQGTLSIAVLDFAPRGATVEEALTISDELRSGLTLTGKCSVMERTKMNDLFNEKGSRQTNCGSDSCIAEKGLQLGTRFIIAGSLGKKADKYLVSARLIDVITGHNVSTTEGELTGNIRDAFGNGINELAKKITRTNDPRLKQSTTPSVVTLAKDTSSTRMQQYSVALPAYFKERSRGIQAGLGLLMDGPFGGSAVMEYGIHKYFSVGGGIGFSGVHVPADSAFYYWHLFIPIGIRGAVHLLNLPFIAERVPANDKLDLYAGFALSYVISIYNWYEPDNVIGDRQPLYNPIKSHAWIQPLIGVRYLFVPKYFAYLEEGSGFGWISLGVGMQL